MTKIVQEGLAKLVIDETADTASFYNPIQEFNRDMTVTVLRQYVCDRENEKTINGKEDDGPPPEKKSKVSRRSKTVTNEPLRILDALSASGLRALRFAQEVDNIGNVIANDFSESSVENIKRNIKANGLNDKISASFDDAKNLMMLHREPSKQFHVVDLDPYGTAAPFLDSAVQSVVDGGLLMVTCTDMAVLCGNTPEACYLKYGATGLKHRSCHEIALRILIRCIDSHANVYGRYIEPLLSMSVDFYVRVFVKVHSSPIEAKMSALKVAHLLSCCGCSAVDLQPIVRKTTVGNSNKYTTAILRSPLLTNGDKCVHCKSSVHIGGPIYSGPIQNLDFIKRLLQRIENTPAAEALGTHSRILGMLTVIAEELHDVPLYYIQDDLLSLVKASCPKQSFFRSAILNGGYQISGTHCNPKGFKTNAPFSFVLDVIRAIVDTKESKTNLPLDTPGGVILETPKSRSINFSFNPASVPQSVSKDLLRYQSNHGKNWGPKSKAKGSVTSHSNNTSSTNKKPLGDKQQKSR
jgi:tRNA (guanine26-N2/guanine27-N2)-dimethyltransferase